MRAVGKRPDDKALQAVLGEVGRMLQTSGLDPAVARASFFLAAAAARSNPAARKQLVAAVQQAIAEADKAASAGGPLVPGKSPRRRSAATDWDLQHSVFAASRAGGTATGADEVSRSFGVGVGSSDAVGARHALAMGVEVASRVSLHQECWCTELLDGSKPAMAFVMPRARKDVAALAQRYPSHSLSPC